MKAKRLLTRAVATSVAAIIVIASADFAEPGWYQDWLHWLQPLLFYQTQSYRGFNLLGGMGIAIPIARSGYRCEDAVLCGQNSLSVVPTISAGLGYAWGPGP